MRQTRDGGRDEPAMLASTVPTGSTGQAPPRTVVGRHGGQNAARTQGTQRP